MECNIIRMGRLILRSPHSQHARNRWHKRMDFRWFTPIHKGTFLIAFLALSTWAFSQDNINQTIRLSGNMTLTTKGLSTFPNLTLGKPAALFDFSIGSGKFRFDPTLRFGLDGKPWTFIFWLRYEPIKTEKFGLRFGAHPAYSFKAIDVVHNGKTSEGLRAYQFLAGEIAPLFKVAENITLGPYYIYSRGIDHDAVQNSNFISFITNFTQISLAGDFFANLMAQVYYLKMDTRDGSYFNSALSFNRRNFPISVSSTINKAINKSIPGDSFLWNINLTWRFGGSFKKEGSAPPLKTVRTHQVSGK